MTNLTKTNKITKKQNIIIDAEELKKYIKDVEKTKKTYDKNGIKIEWISKKNVINIDVKGIIDGYLNIRGTRVKKIKAKNVWGSIDAEGVETLEEIEVEEKIDGILYIEGTNVKKISAQKMLGGISAKGVKTLKIIDIPEIIGYLDIRGTRVSFQLGMIKKINKKELKIKGNIYVGGAIKGINQLCNNKKLIIPGGLDIRGTKVRKINLKYVKGGINAEKVKTLEDIDIEEKIRGNIYIRGTKVKKIKAKYVKGSINAEKVKTLEDIDIEEGIDGNLVIIGTKKEFQKKIIKKIKDGELEMNGKIYFGWIEGIDKLYNKKSLTISGDLDIRGTSVDLQLNIINKIKEEELEIKGDIYFGGAAEGIEKLCNNENLIIPGNLDISGTNVEEINLKKVLGHINAEGVETLKEIKVTEGIDGDLDIRGTNVDFQLEIINKINKKELTVNGQIYFGGNIKGIERLCNNKNLIIPGHLYIGGTNVEEINLKGINGYLDIEKTNVSKISANIIGSINAEGVETLKEMDVPEKINGDLYIEGTSIDFQLEIIDKINKKELTVNGQIYFGGNIKGIERLCNNKNLIIPGHLNIKGTNIDFQKKIINQIENGKLEVNGELFSDIEI